MSEILAYLAGIIDGEGYIGVCRTRPTSANPVGNWRPHLRVSMTDRIPIELLSQTFGGNVATRIPKKINYRVYYVWAIHSTKAVEALKLLLPFLRVKSKQAELCFKLQACKRTHGGRNGACNPLTQAEIDERNAFWLESTRLNARGKQRKIAAWPLAQARKPRPLRELCPHGHVNDYKYSNYTDGKTGKYKRKRICRQCANERARRYRLINREITVVTRRSA